MAYLIQNPGRNSDLLRALAEMLQEMQAHYDVPCPPCEEFLQGLMDRPEGSDILVMTDQNSVIGFAAFSALYPGPALPSCLRLVGYYHGCGNLRHFSRVVSPQAKCVRSCVTV